MKKILITIALVATLVMTGCGAREVVKVNTPKTDAEAVTAYKEIVAMAKEYVQKGNKDGFAQLFDSNSSEKIDEWYENFEEILNGEYVDEDFFVIHDIDENSFWMEYMTSRTTVSGNNKNSEWCQINQGLLYKDGQWKINVSNEYSENLVKNNNYVLPERLVAAIPSNKCSAFSSSYMWTKEDVVVEGDMCGQLYYIWENEDGSVEMLFDMMNGTNEIKNVYNIDISITNANGTIIDKSFSGTTVNPMRSKYLILTVPANEVYQKAENWGSLYEHSSIQYRTGNGSISTQDPVLPQITETPTQAPKPTEAPTQAPKPTEAPTQAPVQPTQSDVPTNSKYEEMIKNEFTPTVLNTFTMSKGDTHKPTASVWLNSDNKGNVYSSNPNVVTVNDHGKVTMVGPGTAYVVIESQLGLYQIYCYTVLDREVAETTAPQTSYTGNAKYDEWIQNDFVSSPLNTYKLSVGSTQSPTASVWLMDGNGNAVSSNPAVVTVDAKGKVTAVGKGSAYVIIETMGGMHQVYLYNVN